MEFQDSVYGDQRVEKPVIRELIGSKPFQRLKGVNQAGPQAFFMDKGTVSRFSHSLGVFFLLKQFDASVEEQIAGLIHDVPHTAFSHLADFVFDTENHEYHERFMEEVVYGSEIPEILESHGFETERILDESRFKLLERDLPDLCADRVDYFFRDGTVYAGLKTAEMLDSLNVAGKRFVLSDKGVAERFALKYIWMDRNHWAAPEEVAVFKLFADIVDRAFELGVLEEDDLFETDEYVFEKLKQVNDDFIESRFELLESDFSVELVGSREEADFVEETKARYVDPFVDSENGLVRVSEFSEQVRREIRRHRDEVEGGYFLRVE